MPAIARPYPHSPGPFPVVAGQQADLFLNFTLEAHLLGRQVIDVVFAAANFVDFQQPAMPILRSENITYALLPHVYSISGCYDVAPRTIYSGRGMAWYGIRHWHTTTGIPTFSYMFAGFCCGSCEILESS